MSCVPSITKTNYPTMFYVAADHGDDDVERQAL